MEINIYIECDTITDLHAHLMKIKETISNHTEKQGLDPLKDEFTELNVSQDNNCYGEHTLIISPTEEED